MLETQTEIHQVIQDKHNNGHFGRDAIYYDLRDSVYFHGRMISIIQQVVSYLVVVLTDGGF